MTKYLDYEGLKKVKECLDEKFDKKLDAVGGVAEELWVSTLNAKHIDFSEKDSGLEFKDGSYTFEADGSANIEDLITNSQRNPIFIRRQGVDRVTFLNHDMIALNVSDELYGIYGYYQNEVDENNESCCDSAFCITGDKAGVEIGINDTMYDTAISMEENNYIRLWAKIDGKEKSTNIYPHKITTDSITTDSLRCSGNENSIYRLSTHEIKVDSLHSSQSSLNGTELFAANGKLASPIEKATITTIFD